MRNTLTVKIIRAKNDVLWYRNKIGKQFEVREEPKKNYYTAFSKENASKIIYKSDCEKV